MAAPLFDPDHRGAPARRARNERSSRAGSWRSGLPHGGILSATHRPAHAGIAGHEHSGPVTRGASIPGPVRLHPVALNRGNNMHIKLKTKRNKFIGLIQDQASLTLQGLDALKAYLETGD